MSFLPALLAGSATGGIVGIQSVQNSINYATNNQFPNTIMGANEVIDLTKRGYLSKELYYLIMRHLGYDDNYARLIFAGSDALVTSEQATLYRIERDLALEYQFENGDLTESQLITARENNLNEFYANVKRQGFRELEADKLFLANRPIPSFSVMLEWLAKEVFEPGAIATFRLDEEQPTALTTYFRKYGVPDEESRKYWISHWNTIGYGQWRELYNRFNSRRDPTHVNNQIKEYTHPKTGLPLTFQDVIIDDEAYAEYFKVLEQTPYFRDRLLGATSEPINFTTLQDLYRYGIINDTELKEFLRDYNWSDYNAQLIVDAWGRKFPFGDRLPKYDNIFYQYKNGLITREQAKTELETAGVTDTIIEFQLDKFQDDIEERRIKSKIKNLAINYGRLKITDAQLQIEINKISADPERREFIKTEIDIIAEKYRNTPSLRQVGRGYQMGTLSLEDFTAYLNNHYYSDSDKVLILKLYAPENPNPDN